MKYILPLVLCAAFLPFCGCRTERLPSEDIEVLQFYPDIIAVLKDTRLSCSSKEKYDAIRKLLKYVDFSFTRETATLDKLLSARDAVVEEKGQDERVLTFNYQYENHYVRLRFYTKRMFVLRVDITEK